jgi:4-hydroxybenzoate polyprenyltransferase
LPAKSSPSTWRPDRRRRAGAAATPDAVAGWVDRLPARVQLFARLARLDRPAGMWLLFWPCLWGSFLGLPSGWWRGWPLFLIGAVAMRSAGCVYNDICDARLDAQVARTAGRPLACGAVSIRAAVALMAALALVGLGVFLTLPPDAQPVALASLLLVAAYPFMKRITWWPQAWLGLTFNWGIPVGYYAIAETARAGPDAMALAYAAGVAWTLGYDTIYAAQDLEDDALAGVRSSARALGSRLRMGVGLFFLATILLLGAALWLWTKSPQALLLLAAPAVHFLWQVATLQPGDPANALRRFRSNFMAGALIALAIAAAALLYARPPGF